ncbi:NAD(P)-binding domain,Polyketide synthase, ketoreductase domain [Cinara cedri]|uniref:NAD(P)-binding domain,Polyketide synthase, ketoreductase domain n=1 Tax=Cinara cedri TaxID=506608 RepID=A0A5E4MWH0_9HEMI|nr:NAD(P)-binding domain,Polyketide synthase, ketoreductase domain [Cinara cedri]
MTYFRRLVNSVRSALQSRSVVSYTLKNRVAVITGGTRGIGLAVAKELITEGASQVIITGRDQNVGVKSLKLLDAICGDKQIVKYCQMDVTLRNDVRSKQKKRVSMRIFVL